MATSTEILVFQNKKKKKSLLVVADKSFIQVQRACTTSIVQSKKNYAMCKHLANKKDSKIFIFLFNWILHKNRTEHSLVVAYTQTTMNKWMKWTIVYINALAAVWRQSSFLDSNKIRKFTNQTAQYANWCEARALAYTWAANIKIHPHSNHNNCVRIVYFLWFDCTEA